MMSLLMIYPSHHSTLNKSCSDRDSVLGGTNWLGRTEGGGHASLQCAQSHLPLRVLAWEAATGGTLLVVILHIQRPWILEEAPITDPTGKAPSFPYNEALDQDSPGNNQGKHLEVPW